MGKGEGGPKSNNYKSKSKSCQCFFRFAASTSNEHNLQNTYPTGVIQHVVEGYKSLVSSKTSSSSRSLAVWKIQAGKGKDISAASRLHLLGNLLVDEPSTKDLTSNSFAGLSVHSKRISKIGFDSSKIHLMIVKMGLQNRVLKWLFWTVCIAWLQGLSWMGK